MIYYSKQQSKRGVDKRNTDINLYKNKSDLIMRNPYIDSDDFTIYDPKSKIDINILINDLCNYQIKENKSVKSFLKRLNQFSNRILIIANNISLDIMKKVFPHKKQFIMSVSSLIVENHINDKLKKYNNELIINKAEINYNSSNKKKKITSTFNQKDPIITLNSKKIFIIR